MCGLFINNSYAEILPHACFVWVCGYLMGLLITKKQSIFLLLVTVFSLNLEEKL